MRWEEIVEKYGLDVSIISFSELNEETRFDAEYHRLEAIKYLKQIKSKSSKTLKDVAKFVVGPFGSTVTVDKYVDDSEYCDVRNLDIKSFEINQSDALIPQVLYEKLKQFHIRQNDLLVTVVGTLGKVALAQEKDTKSIFSCKSTIVRSESIDPYFLATFLNSKVGQILLLRCKRGAIQEGLNLFDLKTLPVAIPSGSFQIKIKNLIIQAFANSKESVNSYSQAKALLLSELGLSDYIPNEANISIRDLFECLQDNRFDAEYWMPKYDEMMSKVTKFNKLGEIAQVKKGSLINPKYYSEYGIPYIRGGDFSANELNDESMIRIASIFNRNNETVLQENDIVFASIGSVGKTAIVTKNFANSFISNNIGKIHINIADFIPQYVQICLQSIICQSQFQRLQTQTAQPKILDSDIRKIKIPFLVKEKQLAISNFVVQSRELKAQSKTLLEKAKRAVEIFIEQDEEKALEYLAS